MLTINEIYTAVKWMEENRAYVLLQWLVDNFGGWNSCLSEMFRRGNLEQLASELHEYDDSIQLELVELMY